MAALIFGTIVWWAIWRGLDPDGDRGSLLTVAAILLLVPPLVLTLFVVALRALIALPRRLREASGALRDRAAEIRRRAADLGARQRGALRSLWSLFRLLWTVSSSRELLQVAGPAAALLTPWMVLAALVAAVAAVVEVLLGAGALLWLALT